MNSNNDLVMKTNETFEMVLCPTMSDILSKITDLYKENTTLKFDHLTLEIGYLEKDQSKNKEIYDKIKVLENEENEFDFDKTFELFKLQDIINSTKNKYIHIASNDGYGYIYYKNQYNVFYCYKTYPFFKPSEDKIDHLSIEKFVSLTNDIGRKYREKSNDYKKFPTRLSLNHIVENYILDKDIYSSAEEILSFSTSHNFRTEKDNFKINIMSDMNELNNSINYLSFISSKLLPEYKTTEKDFVINTYNNNLSDFKKPFALNFKLKFNQVYNIMNEYFKDCVEDFSDLNNYISIVKLKNMPNTRAIFMETQSRNLIAIELENGDIDIYKMAEKEITEESVLSFDYKYHTERGLNEKTLLNVATACGEIADSIHNDTPRYLSIDFFINKFDGTQKLEKEYSSSDSFIFKNISSENGAHFVITNCQRHLCYNKNIDFDQHESFKVSPLENFINKNMTFYKHTYTTRKKSLFNLLWCAYDENFYKGKIEDGNGTETPMVYQVVKDNENDFEISWYDFTETLLTRKIPDNINEELFLGIKECFLNVQNYYENNPDKIEDQETYNTLISKIKKNIEDFEYKC